MPSGPAKSIAAAALLLCGAVCAFLPSARAGEDDVPPPATDGVELDTTLPPLPADGLEAATNHLTLAATDTIEAATDQPPPTVGDLESVTNQPTADTVALESSTNQPPPPPGFFEEKGAARGRYIAENRGIEVDEEGIRKDQQRILRKLNSHARDALYSGINSFTKALDRWHDNTFLFLDNTIRTLDICLGPRDSEYEHELSSFVLSLSGRAGGRGNKRDYEAKVRFRGDIALPGLENRFRLVTDNLGRDDLPGTDPMLRESDLRVGFSSSWKSFFGNRWDLGGGIRVHHFIPIGYVDLTWDWSANWRNSTFKFDPRVVWYTDDGFGHDASFSWTSDRSRHTIWQLVTAESVREHESGVHLEETLRVGFPHHAKGCGWIVQASLFPHVVDSDHTFIDDAILNITWRDALYRRWMYYSITPQVDFAVEDGHEPEASLRIGIVILFGRETGNLL